MYFYFSFSTTKPGWLILKPHRTTVMAVRDISQHMSLWQVLVDEFIWIIRHTMCSYTLYKHAIRLIIRTYMGNIIVIILVALETLYVMM